MTAKDTGWNKIMRDARGSVSMDVGLVGPKATAKHGSSKKSVAEIGAFHEFGTGTIPERSFLRATINANQARYLGLMNVAAQAVLGGLSHDAAFSHVAEVIANDMKQMIRSGLKPELSDETVAKKGSDQVLIDTEQMIDAIGHRVTSFLKKTSNRATDE